MAPQVRVVLDRVVLAVLVKEVLDKAALAVSETFLIRFSAVRAAARPMDLNEELICASM